VGRSASRRWFFGLGAVACVTASCSLLVDTSDLSGGAALPAGDAGHDATDSQVSVHFDAAPEAATDAKAPLEAGPQADADAAPPIEAGPRKNSCGALLFGTPVPVFNGDFEQGCSNGFTGYATVPANDTSAPSNGALACRLCYLTGGGPDGYFITANVPRNVVAGERYEAVACIRTIPGGDAGTPVHVEIGVDQDVNLGGSVAVSATYTEVRMGWDVKQSHDHVGINVRGITEEGACFLIDDLSLSLIKDAGP